MSTNYASLPRLYINTPIAPGEIVLLASHQSHYLCTVLRSAAQDQVRIFNQSQGEYLAEVIKSHARAAALKVLSLLRPHETPAPLTLVFAPLRKERLHFLVEKAVELGVSSLMPILTDRTTQRNFSEEKAEKHIIEATEQSERLGLATLAPLQSLTQLLTAWPKDHILFFCKERSGAEPLAQSLLDQPDHAPGAFLVGPEGGFTDQEAFFIESFPFVRPISLGYHILRSETAAISALGFWQLYQNQKRSLLC